MIPFARHLAVGLGSGALALLLGALPPGELFELKSHDLFLSSVTSGRAPDNVVIVAIDEPSFAELGLQWPWPRRLHARLVDTVASAGASVIGFDVVFAEPSNEADDAEFARAIRAAGRVVLASSLEFLDDHRASGTMLIGPLDRFATGATSGLVTIPLDRDFVVRRFLEPVDNGPTFAEAIARMHARPRTPVGTAPPGAYLAYAGPPGSFATVSYYQALDPANHLPPGFFANKIVLVGRVIKASPEPGRSAPDVFATPFLFGGRGSLMSGVEIQANMIDGILRGRFVRRVSGAPVAMLALVFGLAGSFLQWRWRPLRGALLALLFLAALVGGSLAAFFAGGLWLPLLPALAGAVAPYGWFGALSYLEGEKKRRELRQAFSRYLSPAILHEVLKKPGELKLGGARAEVTLLFSDLAGFTTLSESMAPEEVGRFLNRYFTEMTRIVFAHHGTVDKFVGDALIAFWGAPVPDPDHALHACRAALAMQARLETLRVEMRRENFPAAHARIGLNTGEVVVGNMGSAELFNYTVLGDAVNLAARLEGLNKEFGTRILVARSVVDRTGNMLDVRPLGAIKARGRTGEVEIFELLGARRETDGPHSREMTVDR